MEKEKRTWTVTLADGSTLEELTLNPWSNTFHSETEISESVFDGNLSEVHIAASDGDMSMCAYPDVLYNAELVQVMTPDKTPDKKWAFILREIPAETLFRAKVQAQLDYLAMSADVDLEDM